MDDREQVIVENIPLVKSIASKFNVSNIGIDYDDLVSIGLIGLMDAYDKYDDSKGAKFSTYATLKVKSHIIDEIRKLSPVTRTDMQKVKLYNNCVEVLSVELDKKPSIVDISNYMGVSIKEVKLIEKIVSILNVTSLDNVVGSMDGNLVTIKDTLGGDDLSPSDIIEYEDDINTLVKCIDKLKDRDKLILSLYYNEELTLKEVGEVIGLSESRVSILHTKAISKLREELLKLGYNYIEGCVV